MRQSILRYFISLLLVSLCICSATSIFIISGSMKEDSEREMMYSVKLIEYNLDYSGDLNKQIETLNPLAFSDDTELQKKVGTEKYDIVVANILADVIIPMAPALPLQKTDT